MSYRALISDWNGTLFQHPTDEAMNKKIGYAILNGATQGLKRGNIFKLGDVIGLLKAKGKIKKRLQEYRKGKRGLGEVYEPFNRHAIRGRPVSFINGVVDEFCRESVGLVDCRMLRPIRRAYERGIATGILSTSYEYSIRRILEMTGFADAFHHISANILQADGERALGFTADIYERKPEVLRHGFFDRWALRKGDTIYMGDSEDDEKVAEMLPPGDFIVPFFASEEYRQRMASRHKAFVPASEADLDTYLRNK
jgi:phosphoserine phosphatase